MKDHFVKPSSDRKGSDLVSSLQGLTSLLNVHSIDFKLGSKSPSCNSQPLNAQQLTLQTLKERAEKASNVASPYVLKSLSILILGREEVASSIPVAP